MQLRLSLLVLCGAAWVLLCTSALASPQDGPITVHLVPHSHDDVGYEKTVEQYYYDSNATIRAAGVQYTLDSIIPTLLANPERKYIQVETAFFYMWWREQDDDTKAKVHQVVQSGQLEFISGGWCMHDEGEGQREAVGGWRMRRSRELQRTHSMMRRCGLLLVS
jgi:hypothetical protein